MYSMRGFIESSKKIKKKGTENKQSNHVFHTFQSEITVMVVQM